jgi:single-strand DNA-binding protein
MNIFAFTGNLGSNAEQRYTPSGDSIVSFNVAVKAGFGDKAVTTWVKCNLWGKRGDSVLPYLNKGQLVGISGELANRKWQDKEGQDRYSLEVRVNELDLLGGKQEQREAPEKHEPKRVNHGDDLESDLPF